MQGKGIVVEVGAKNKVVILTTEGEFKRVPCSKNAHVGQEIRYQRSRGKTHLLQLGLAATLFLTLVGTWPLLQSMNFFPKPSTAYVVTLDFNSSLEIQLSDEEKVLSVAGLNSSGEKLARSLALQGNTFEAALAKLAKEPELLDYLTSTNNQLVATVASRNEGNVVELSRKRNLATLSGKIKSSFQAKEFAQVQVLEIPFALQNEAKLAGIIPSRYVAIQNIAKPSKEAVRLTINDNRQQQQLAAGSERQPNLQPVQWINTAQNPTRYGIDFSGVVEAKGDFRVNR